MRRVPSEGRYPSWRWSIEGGNEKLPPSQFIRIESSAGAQKNTAGMTEPAVFNIHLC